MKAPKRPKFAKVPKQPKATASAQTWKNYEQKLNAVKAANDKKLAEYNKEKRAYDAEMKKRQSLKEKASKLRGALCGIR